MADKGLRMVRYCGFQSPVKRCLPEDVVRHNGDSEKNSKANNMEGDASAVTAGCPAEMRAVRKADAFYEAEAGRPSGRADHYA